MNSHQQIPIYTNSCFCFFAVKVNMLGNQLAKFYTVSLAVGLLISAVFTVVGQNTNLRSLLSEVIEYELSGGEKHVYPVQLKKDEFFQVRVEQKGIDVELLLNDSNGKLLAHMDSPNGNTGFETLTFIADATTEYNFVVKSFDEESPKGKYSIKREPSRMATMIDAKRITAERFFVEGVANINAIDKVSIEQSITNFQKVLPIWDEIKDEYMSIQSRNALRNQLEKISNQADKTQPELVVQTDHDVLIQSIAFSRGNNIMATSGGDGTIKLWEVGSGRLIRTLTGHPPIKIDTKPVDSKNLLFNVFSQIAFGGISNSAYALAFSPGGKTLASGSIARSIIIWDIATGEPLKLIKSPVSVWFLSFSQDGQTILSSSELKSEEGKFRFYDVSSGKELTDNIPPLNTFRLSWKSPDLSQTAIYSEEDAVIKIKNSADLQEKLLAGHDGGIRTVSFSPNGELLASGGWDRTVRIWNVQTKTSKVLGKHDSFITSLAFSPDGKLLASGSADLSVKTWEIETGKELNNFFGYTNSASPFAFGKDDGTLITADRAFASLWDLNSGHKRATVRVHSGSVSRIVFSPDKKMMATGDQTVVNITQFSRLYNFKKPADFDQWKDTSANQLHGDSVIRLFNFETGELKEFKGHTEDITAIAFSPNGKILASSAGDRTIKLWNTDKQQDQEPISFAAAANALTFSPDGEYLAFGGDGNFKLWNVKSKTEISLPSKENGGTAKWIIFTDEGKGLVSLQERYDGQKILNKWSLENLPQTSLQQSLVEPQKIEQFLQTIPNFFQKINLPYSADNNFRAEYAGRGKIGFYDNKTNTLLAWLVDLGKEDWAVVTPEGRFDTNKLENSKGLSWVFPDNPLKPYPFEILMRDYYEPGLLPRLIKCTKDASCKKEFKELSKNVSALNRTQPKIEIKNIFQTTSPEIVKVTVEAQNIESDFQKDSRENFLYSGAKDLRLFLNGQLVGYAPDGEGSVALDNNGKFTRTFTIRLPKIEQAKEFNFTAYAFNNDRVKSETVNQTYSLPKPMPKALGKAYLVTVGVNASDNPAYNLRYAANDARKMQEIVGAKLKANVGDKYSEFIQIPLISDAEAGKEVNDARKEIIKGVFSMLAGHLNKVPKDVLRRIEKIAHIPAVEPEDTLIIAFSGHGYADQNGIFYMLPADIPKDTTALTTEALQHAISSDELSLWMRDITANEMIMIIDACHSAAAVQGEGFKPGPMGSRGLGQLAYDKGMKILSATQANNIALESNSLQQGLLSYALLQDGIEATSADVDKDKRLFSSEWLTYAENRVPQLYQAMKDGKLNILVDGKYVTGSKGQEVIQADDVKSKLNLQQPTLFDFKRRNSKSVLFSLP